MSIGALTSFRRNPVTRLIPAAALTALIAAPLGLQAQRPTTLAGRATVYAPNGAVATSQPLAAAAFSIEYSPLT